MDNTKPIYYVYSHVDPITKDVLYVGHGTRGRAWNIAYEHTLTRSQPHGKHLVRLIYDGFLACDFVNILHRNLFKTDACAIERDLIESLSPKYNKDIGLSNLRLTPDVYDAALSLRSEGNSYSQIATQLGLSAMTIWRGLNGQTKHAKGATV